jgi:hypothetical protein
MTNSIKLLKAVELIEVEIDAINISSAGDDDVDFDNIIYGGDGEDDEFDSLLIDGHIHIDVNLLAINDDDDGNFKTLEGLLDDLLGKSNKIDKSMILHGDDNDDDHDNYAVAEEKNAVHVHVGNVNDGICDNRHTALQYDDRNILNDFSDDDDDDDDNDDDSDDDDDDDDDDERSDLLGRSCIDYDNLNGADCVDVVVVNDDVDDDHNKTDDHHSDDDDNESYHIDGYSYDDTSDINNYIDDNCQNDYDD